MRAALDYANAQAPSTALLQDRDPGTALVEGVRERWLAGTLALDDARAIVRDAVRLFL